MPPFCCAGIPYGTQQPRPLSSKEHGVPGVHSPSDPSAGRNFYKDGHGTGLITAYIIPLVFALLVCFLMHLGQRSICYPSLHACNYLYFPLLFFLTINRCYKGLVA